MSDEPEAETEEELTFEEDGGGMPDFVWFAGGPDEYRRAYILNLMAAPEIDGAILLRNMSMVEQWLKDGTMPATAPKRSLQAVKE
jgi:hypothetical protein